MTLSNNKLKNREMSSELCNCIIKSNDSKTITENKSNVEQMKAKSAPNANLLKSSTELLKTQTSAPSYFHSLKENESPPFRKPEKERKPHLLIGTIVTEEDVIEMITAAESDHGLKKHIGTYLINKYIVLKYNRPEKDLLVSLVLECIDYAAQRDFPAFKLACLMTIYLTTHLHFKFYYWLSPISVWSFFKEVMICHTIEDSPDGQEVFSPEECYDILSHFHTIYLSNLPLIHILTFGVHRLKFIWPFNPK